MRQALGLLRARDAGATLAPQPSLRDVEQLAQQSRDAGVPVELTVAGDPAGLPAGLDLSAYRIVQEALTNITRHAQATRVSITLKGSDHELQLTIQDNGVGFIQGGHARNPGSFGLLGIRERVLMLGGRLSAGNAPEGGARLVVHVPLAQPSAAALDEIDQDAVEPLFDATTRDSLDGRETSP